MAHKICLQFLQFLCIICLPKIIVGCELFWLNFPKYLNGIHCNQGGGKKYNDSSLQSEKCTGSIKGGLKMSITKK